MTRTIMRNVRSAARRGLTPHRVAYAHSGVQSYVYLVLSDGEFRGSVQFPIHDLNHVLDLNLPEAEAEAAAAVSATRSELEQYALKHLTIGDGAAAWRLEFGIDRVLASAKGTYAILEYRIAEQFDDFPSQVTITYDGILHAYPDRNARVFVKTERGWGPFRRTPEDGRTFTAGNTTETFTVEEETLGKDLTGTASVMSRRLVKKGRGLARRLSGS